MASPSLNPAAGLTANNSAATITSGTLTTTVANCVIFACIFWDKTAASVSSVVSVTGGLSFTHLGGKIDGTTTGTDVWYLQTSGTFSDTIKATLNATPGNGSMSVFGVKGCAASPFDPNSGLPVTGQNTTSPASLTYSTTNADDLILVAIGNGSTTSGSGTAPGVPTSWSSIGSGTNAAGSGGIGYRTALFSVSAAQSGSTMSSTIGTVETWTAFLWAVTADSGDVLQSQAVF